jgi:ankyrin repeat protein
MHANTTLLYLILKQEPLTINTVCSQNHTALSWASRMKKPQHELRYNATIQLLLDHGASLLAGENLLTSPLIAAAKSGCWTGLYKMLLVPTDQKGLSEEALANVLNSSPFMLSLAQTKSTPAQLPGLLTVLRSHGMNMQTLLDTTVQKGNLEMTQLVLGLSEVYVTARTLTLAIICGSVVLVRRLLAQDVDINLEVNANYISSLVLQNLHLALAFRHGSIELIDCIIQEANPSPFVCLQNLHAAIFAQFSRADTEAGLQSTCLIGPALVESVSRVIHRIVDEQLASDDMWYNTLRGDEPIESKEDQQLLLTELENAKPCLNTSEVAFRLCKHILVALGKVTSFFAPLTRRVSGRWARSRSRLLAHVQNISDGLPLRSITKFRISREVALLVSDDCSICLEPVRESPASVVKLSCCTHAFHYDCIAEWFKRTHTCPLCRQTQLET